MPRLARGKQCRKTGRLQKPAAFGVFKLQWRLKTSAREFNFAMWRVVCITQCSFLRAVLTNSPWIKITKITMIYSFYINQFTCVCSASLQKCKNKQFCIQEFSAYREFYELTRQGGNLGVL